MKNKINLLLPKEQTLSDKIIYFALHYLRYILVVTQICVIYVFFFRFRVDQEIIDLKDGLTQKQEIVTVSKPLIAEAQAVDKKVKAVQDVLGRQDLLTQMLNYVLTRFPESATLDNLKISGSSMKFSGESRDAAVLQLFLKKLREDNKFRVIQLKNIQRSKNGYAFNFDLQDFSVDANE